MGITVRPRRARLASRVAAGLVVVVFAVVAVTLPAASRGVHVEASDQVGVLGIGLVVAAAVLCLGRPRVDADARGLRVRNLLGERAVPWDAVRAVEFRDGSPWASLALDHDEPMALMAVQSFDGERTVEAVTTLRALLAQSRADRATPGRPGQEPAGGPAPTPGPGGAPGAG